MVPEEEAKEGEGAVEPNINEGAAAGAVVLLSELLGALENLKTFESPNLNTLVEVEVVIEAADGPPNVKLVEDG